MNPYRITSIHLTEVGPFKELHLDLPPTKEGLAEVHILTGENGTGKTSVLEAISALFVDYFYTNNWKPSKIKRGISRIHAAFLNYELFFDDNRSVPNVEFQIDTGLLKNNNLHGLVDSIRYIKFAPFAYSGLRRTEDILVAGINEMGISPVANIVNFDKSVDSQIFKQWLINTQARELMAKGRGEDNKATITRKRIEILEQALSDVTRQTIFFELEDNPFQAKLNVDGQSLNFDQIPDGLKSMVSWLGDLLMRMDRIQWADDVPVLERPFLLLLDEIDVHLHPAWQRRILPMVQKLFPNAQVIVSTHSPFVVGSVDGAWVHKFVKKDEYSVLNGPPIASEDAKSYEHILEEIFGITERFGVEIEARLAEFQSLKKQLLRNDSAFDEARFRQLIGTLSGQSAELDSLLGIELKQLQRLTQQSFIE